MPQKPANEAHTRIPARVQTFQLLPRRAYRLTLPDDDVFVPARTSGPTVARTPFDTALRRGNGAPDSTGQETVTSPTFWDYELEHVECNEGMEQSTHGTYPRDQDSGYVTNATTPSSAPARVQLVSPADLSRELEQLQNSLSAHPLYDNLRLNVPATKREAQESHADLDYLISTDNLDGQVQVPPNAPENDFTIAFNSNRFYPSIRGDLEKTPVFIARKQYLLQLFRGGQYNTVFQRPIRRCIGGTDTLEKVWIDMCLYNWGLIPQRIEIFGRTVDTLRCIWNHEFSDLLETFSESTPNQSLVFGEQKFELSVWYTARYCRCLRMDPDAVSDRCKTADDFACSIYATGNVTPTEHDDFLWNIGGFFEPSQYLSPEVPEYTAEDFRIASLQLIEKWRAYVMARVQYMEGTVPVDFFGRVSEEDVFTQTFELEKEFLERIGWAESVDAQDPFHCQEGFDECGLEASLESEEAPGELSSLIPRTIWTWSGLRARGKKPAGSSGSCGDQFRKFEDF